MELLKKELAVATLQQRLGKEVEYSAVCIQNHFTCSVQEQLMIIKKELGLKRMTRRPLQSGSGRG